MFELLKDLGFIKATFQPGSVSFIHKKLRSPLKLWGAFSQQAWQRNDRNAGKSVVH